MRVAEQIKQYRKKAGLTQQELADKAGITRVSVGKYETDRTVPSVETGQKIAVALGITMDTLLGEENKKNREFFQNYYGSEEYLEHEKKMEEYERQLEQIREDQESVVIKAFFGLNTLGQIRAMQYLDELAEIENYKPKV